jgi:hypothetical protein
LDQAVRALSYENQRPEGSVQALNPHAFKSVIDMTNQLWRVAKVVTEPGYIRDYQRVQADQLGLTHCGMLWNVIQLIDARERGEQP